jgi:hypothetical protein
MIGRYLPIGYPCVEVIVDMEYGIWDMGYGIWDMGYGRSNIWFGDFFFSRI